MTCPGRVQGTDVFILVPHHSNCPHSSLTLAMGLLFSKIQGGCLEMERTVHHPSSETSFYPSGSGKVDYNKECAEESRMVKPGSCPLTGSPKPQMWASIQLFCHPRPFLQMLPLHLPQGPSRITAFSTPDSPLSSLICILVLHSKNLSLLEGERLV